MLWRALRHSRVTLLWVSLFALMACGPDEFQPMKAPLFRLKSMQGEEIALENLRGKIVILDFWATWCAPCEDQIPILNQFYERNRDQGVVVLGISMDIEGAEVIEPFLKEHEIRYPILLGQMEVAEAYGLRALPGSAVIDAEGNLRSAHVGIATESMLEKLVARARKPLQKPVVPAAQP